MHSHIICTACQSPFGVTDEDKAFLDKVAPEFNGRRESIPLPTHCPDCRQQRRSAQINELNLFKNTCAFTGKPVISDVHPSSPFKVYAQPVWFSDQWDARDYGRDFDFKRTFAEQYRELQLSVPYPCLYTAYEFDENSEYTNYAGKNKNCYLIFDSDENRDSYYSYSINGCTDCTDLYRVRGCELCTECIDVLDSYNCSYLQDCNNCRDSMFLQNCTGCSNCIFSCNLQNKQYYVHNKQVTPEEYAAILAQLNNRETLEQARKSFAEYALQFPRKAMHGVQNENVSGDYLTNSKSATECFDGANLWDCKRVYRAFMPVKDSMDCEAAGEAELLYECSTMGYNALHNLFSANCLNQISNLLYCSFCEYTSDSFGCVGIRKRKYCIFNKQYTKEEYEELVPRIIAHMRTTGEWGEFFPVTLSIFPYNDTLAQLYYPLEKEAALTLGYGWRDEDQSAYKAQTVELPQTIADTADSLIDETLQCRTCTKNYKVIAQELELLHKLQKPVPDTCLNCRHLARMEKRNPRTLFDRQCMHCQKAIQTTYSPERPEIVYCEECYLDAVY